MPNVTEIYTLATQSVYMSDGVRGALEGLLRFLPPALQRSDNITFYSNPSISTLPIDIDTGATSRPLAIIVESRGSSGFLRIYQEAGSASVSTSESDVTPALVVPFDATTGDVTAMFIGGAGYDSFWAAGIQATTSGAKNLMRTSATNLPRVYMLYVNA